MARFANEALKAISDDIKICDWNGEGKPKFNTKNINFNGDGGHDLDHESFNLYGTMGGFNFCKTARKPYDVLVKAILMYADELSMFSNSWSFDGEKTEIEYKEGEILYLKTLMSLGLASVEHFNKMEELELELSV